MEALAVVGLVGNILQFVDSTKKLVSATKQVSNLGAKEENIELAVLARELKAWASRVAPPEAPNGAKFSDEEASIRLLGDQCTKVAEDLLDVLETLRVKNDGILGRVESFYKALLGEWKKEEVGALQSRLDRIGSVAQKHLQNYDARRIMLQLSHLEAGNSRLQAHRGKEIQGLGKQIDELFKDIGRKLEDEESRRHTMEALLNASTRSSRYSTEQMILEQLRFASINDRHDTIRDVHEHSLGWVFGTSEQQSPATFDDWLTSENNLYWISGKPGSGKSTLMKFLCAHPRTAERLSAWTGSDRLVLASYFFWNAGRQELQKSQEGLLRSVVYQLLRQCPDLIPQVYPVTWRLYLPDDSIESPQDSNLRASGTVSLTIEGLIGTLREVCAAAVTKDFKVCFFIDGLDEYYGQPSDMVDLTRTLRSLPGVKMCLSSRSWNEFEQEFGKGGTCKLYMQEHNREDINNYVYDTFNDDENYQDLEDRDTLGKAFLNEIIESSNGVFLWVFLVVRSFQEGLLNGDRISDLQRRLDAFPRDLNQYFERIILSDVDEFYRGQCAEMFSVTLEGAEDLALIAYWFMGEEDPDYAIRLDTKPIPLQQLNRRFKAMKKRLNACCKGMLEVQYLAPRTQEASLPSSVLFNWKVNFLHRTVRDFLLLDETQDTLRRWHSPTFSPHESICKALLAQIKISPEDREYWALESPTARLYDCFHHHADSLISQGRGQCVGTLVRSLNESLALRAVEFPIKPEKRQINDQVGSAGQPGGAVDQAKEATSATANSNSGQGRLERMRDKFRGSRWIRTKE